MTAGNRCDGPACGVFGPPGFRWLYLVQQPAEVSIMSALGLGQQSEPLTFCSMRCVAGYCYVASVSADAATGSEPAPRSGIGWPK